MPPRLFLRFVPVFLVAALAVVSACGGDDDDGGTSLPGGLSDPGNVPTATPWAQAPEVVLLDPDNLVPLAPGDPIGGGPDGGPPGTPVAGEPGVCGSTYTVEAGDITVNIAEKCGVTVAGIEAANPDVDIRSLQIGQVLILPDAAVVDPEEVVPDESSEDVPAEEVPEEELEPEEITPEPES